MEEKEEIRVNEEQSYQIYTKNGITKFYVNGVEIKNVKKVIIGYDAEKGKPEITFEIKGTTSTAINVATLDKRNNVGKV